MKSERPLSSLPSNIASVRSSGLKSEPPARLERAPRDANGRPTWLEPWLEAEEEAYDLPCTD